MPIVTEVELGYTFAKEHWGCGYATECATAVRDFAFRGLKLSQLVSAIAPTNAASKAVARKLGLEYSGVITAFNAPFERYELSRQKWIGLHDAA
jgi:RimJ/RimL family protein N-acetyltransferase